MSLFRKRKVELPDDLVVKTDFTNNDNDQQELVQNQVTSLEQIQTEAKEPYVVTSTYPVMRIGTAQRLLTKVAESMSADMNPINVTLDFLEQIDGRHGVNQEHRYDVDIAIDYAFKNLTVPVLKDLFNNDNYDDWDFATKTVLAKAIVDNCAAGKDIIAGDLAKVPDTEPLNGEEVVIETVTPSGMLSVETANMNPSENTYADSGDHREIQEPTSQELDIPTPAGSTQVGNMPGLRQSEATAEQPHQRSTVPTPDSETQKQSEPNTKKEAERPFNQVAQVEILLPRFEVQDVPAVSPDDPGYVQYRMNERAKQNNQAIDQVENQINASLTKSQFDLSVNYQKIVDQKIEKREETAPLDVDHIRQVVLDQNHQSLEQEQKNLRKKVNVIRDNKIAEAQATFDRLKSKAEQEADSTYSQGAQQLTADYQTHATKKLMDALSDGQKAHEKDLAKYRDSLSKTSETDLRAQLLALQEQAQTKGSTIIQSLLDGNETFEAQVNSEHSNALNAATANYRSQTNWKHVSDAENEVNRLKAQNAELHKTKAQLETSVDELKNEKQQALTNTTQLKAQIEQLTTDNKVQSERLDKLISTATGKETVTAGMSTNELLTTILLGQYRQTGTGQTPAETSNSASNPVSKKSWGKAAGVLMAGGLLLGGTGFWINQRDQEMASAQRSAQSQLSRKLAIVESQANSQSKTAQSSSRTSAENQAKLESAESVYKQRMKDFEKGAAMAAKQTSTQSSSADTTNTK
ncbi:hypothetical protein CCS05_12325 (plasmid) [Levilactobacillus brevis]|uniref:hypothetical protein n=1 Tax=Levilactobacillus brevis TaxID=1580 RepID=UPI000D729424|nr:hypothetical protein [Levilactobacillus brevis]AWP47707.1 hypothetical protein CCS05_12325 [Levilactobacillus brevis]